jgi:hypothetical protein
MLPSSDPSTVAFWIPVALAASLAMGILGTFLPGAGRLFVASGVVFGAAFTAMTVEVAFLAESRRDQIAAR